MWLEQKEVTIGFIGRETNEKSENCLYRTR